MRIAPGSEPASGSDSANAGDHSPDRAPRQEALLELVGAEQLDRQRARAPGSSGSARSTRTPWRSPRPPSAASACRCPCRRTPRRTAARGRPARPAAGARPTGTRPVASISAARGAIRSRDDLPDRVAEVQELLRNRVHVRDGLHRPDASRVEAKSMGIGTSIFLIAVGAILKFAVTASVSGIEAGDGRRDPHGRRRDRTADLAVPDRVGPRPPDDGRATRASIRTRRAPRAARPPAQTTGASPA